MAKALKKANTVSHDGIFVYIGPSVRGIIQNGSVFRGDRSSVLQKNASAIEFCQKIERLIVPDSEIMSAKKKLKEGGNSISIAFAAVIQKINGKE